MQSYKWDSIIDSGGSAAPAGSDMTLLPLSCVQNNNTRTKIGYSNIPFIQFLYSPHSQQHIKDMDNQTFGPYGSLRIHAVFGPCTHIPLTSFLANPNLLVWSWGGVPPPHVSDPSLVPLQTLMVSSGSGPSSARAPDGVTLRSPTASPVLIVPLSPALGLPY